MAYRYCLNTECGEALSKPTVHEAATEEQLCPSCGTNNSREWDLADLLVDLTDRVEALEGGT